jgi:hypothetical protein
MTAAKSEKIFSMVTVPFTMPATPDGALADTAFKDILLLLFDLCINAAPAKAIVGLNEQVA